MSVLIILLLPLIAAALACVRGHRLWAPVVTVAANLAGLALAVRLVWATAAGHFETAVMNVGLWRWIAVDGLSALVLLLVAFVGATASIYSAGYMAHGDLKPEKLRLYYANYNLFIFSMLAIPVLAEPTLVWIVVELTTLCSALLVSFDNTRAALEAAWKYVVLSLMGAGVALFGFLVLFAAMRATGGGVYTWSGLVTAAPAMPPVLLRTAFVLILIGLGTKVGLVPMHTWLPDAHSQAPSPVCALLSGVETTAVLYVILRLLPVMQAAPGLRAGTWAMALGLVSAGTAAFLLLQVRDYKRLFAFSTVEHMGIILFAAGLGGAGGSQGAVMQMLSHSVTKSFCFFAAGAALLTLGTRQIASARGLFRSSTAAGAALLFGALAIGGAPPFAVFLSEFSIIRSGLVQHRYLATLLLVLFITVAFFGIMRHVNRMVFGRPEAGARGSLAAPVPLPFTCRLALLLSAVPVLVFGVWMPESLHALLRQAAQTLVSP